MAETRKLAAILCSDVVGYSRLAAINIVNPSASRKNSKDLTKRGEHSPSLASSGNDRLRAYLLGRPAPGSLPWSAR